MVGRKIETPVISQKGKTMEIGSYELPDSDREFFRQTNGWGGYYFGVDHSSGRKVTINWEDKIKRPENTEAVTWHGPYRSIAEMRVDFNAYQHIPQLPMPALAVTAPKSSLSLALFLLLAFIILAIIVYAIDSGVIVW